MPKAHICPYIISDKAKSIVCEGIMDSTEQEISFKTDIKKREFIKLYCGNDHYWKCCEYAKLLNEKYEDLPRKYIKKNLAKPNISRQIKYEVKY